MRKEEVMEMGSFPFVRSVAFQVGLLSVAFEGDIDVTLSCSGLNYFTFKKLS